MFPGMTGTCDSENATKVAEIHFCAGMLQKAADQGTCVIYNFGVGSSDEFLSHLGAKFPKCKVFAFDPTVSEATFADRGGVEKVFGANVTFKNWGLYGGSGPRTTNWTHPIYGKVTGTYYTLGEIRAQLGHTQTYISLFRSDCEGCEWGWVPTQMREDPSVFGHLDQMFIEVHFASTLRFNDELISEAPVMHKMISDNFNVLWSEVNKGFDSDQNMVPSKAVAAGVPKEPCCREFNLIRKKSTFASATRA